jgi:hypothetical protein
LHGVLERVKERGMSDGNLLHDHPSEEVRAATVRLLDALTQWERSTGRKYLVIVKEGGRFSYRSLCGGPAPEMLSDRDLLDSYRNMP